MLLVRFTPDPSSGSEARAMFVNDRLCIVTTAHAATAICNEKVTKESELYSAVLCPISKAITALWLILIALTHEWMARLS